jgi:chromosome segregation ATPase
VAQGVQDSLHKIYSATITGLDTQLNAAKNNEGLLKGELGNKLNEIYRLRAEIAGILKNSNAKKEDLVLARQKTAELQQLVLELQGKNSTIEEEKQQISAVLDKVNVQVKNLEGGIQQLTTDKEQLVRENKVLTDKITLAETLMASEVKLTPVMVKNEKETETTHAAKVSKMVVSFAVQNNVAAADDAEVYVIVNQPDGTVMKPDAWESSSALQTKNGEKKIYTRKIKFEYARGEAKRLFFSLDPDDYQRGNYTMQLYHNGYMIGQTSKNLN